MEAHVCTFLDPDGLALSGQRFICGHDQKPSIPLLLVRAKTLTCIQVTSKNPYSWLISLWNHPYHYHAIGSLDKMSFDQFLRRPWVIFSTELVWVGVHVCSHSLRSTSLLPWFLYLRTHRMSLGGKTSRAAEAKQRDTNNTSGFLRIQLICGTGNTCRISSLPTT